MISKVDSIGEHLTIFTFLRIVLMHTSSSNIRANNDYKTAIVFSDPQHTYTDQLIKIINTESRIPTKIFTFEDGTLLNAARQYEGPSDLSIFAFYRSSNLIQFKEIQHSLFYTDHRLLLIMSSDESDQDLLDSIREHLSGFRSYLIFCPNGELWLYRNLQSNSANMARYQLDLTDPVSVMETIHSIANWRKADLPFWSPIMFVHYYPPFNMVVPNYNAEGKYIATELMGPDPLVAYDIAKRLNASARIVTDLDTVSVGYDSYFGDNPKESSFADYLHVIKYYDRVALNRPPFHYNWT